MFYDEVTVNLKAGDGGNGSASFRREKYIPKGGPDGGDGGKGGNVYIVPTPQLSDLIDYASTHDFSAENGVDGAGQKLFGRGGSDLTLSVPIGTKIFRVSNRNKQLLADLVRKDDPFLLLRGGKGGLGNVHFATATHQAPRYGEPGEPGQLGQFTFELEIIADVGIIGLPNTGKSTLLSHVSAARPKIADYPFTTLSPVLGIVELYGQRYVWADIPGLIEGASEGKGLGQKFLRHIRRTKTLLHLIAADSTNYARDYRLIRAELTKFDPGLGKKNELVAISKLDLLANGVDSTQIIHLKAALDPSSQLFERQAFSASSRVHLDELVRGSVKTIGRKV